MKLTAIFLLVFMIQVSAKSGEPGLPVTECNVSLTGTSNDIVNEGVVTLVSAPKVVNATDFFLKGVRFGEIHGRVVDKQGNALANVSVLLTGTSAGTTTDNDGKFTIKVPDGNTAVLEFSSVGYLSKDVDVANQTEINVVLELDVAGLQNVVVVGYGTQRKSDLTGSISTVDMSGVASTPTTNFQTAIQGKVPGVTVSTPTGGPGATPQITIRGTGSIGAGNDPLYVINGIPMPDNANLNIPINKQTNTAFQSIPPSPLAAINSHDIESINILKGPSATAIYGSRGSNGVVIVTTKQGTKDEKPRNSSDAASGLHSVPRRMR